MNTEKTINEVKGNAVLPLVIGSVPLPVEVICDECHHRHYKHERVVKKGILWSTTHCAKCGCVSIYL